MSKSRKLVPRICEYCNKPFDTPTKGKTTARFCSKSCGSKSSNQRPEARAAARLRAYKPDKRICEWCSNEFITQPHDKKRFCGKSCANYHKGSLPAAKEWGKELNRRSVKATTGIKRPDTSERQRGRLLSQATREKISKSLQGRTFLARGGNGQITVPQKLLADALNLPTEYAIPTAPVYGQFPSLPTNYKVDIAWPQHYLAIEVDGRSHRTRKWKFLDKRKTEILNALGWMVIRFTNEQVMNELAACVQVVQEKRS